VAAGTKGQFFPTLTTVHHLPCSDLQAIDRLWVKYSQGKFGYSVQQKIYRQAIAESSQLAAQMQFHRRTDFAKKTLSLAAPTGHLPSSGRYLWTKTSRLIGGPHPFSISAFAKRQDWCGD
jgi:GUN4-like